MILWFIKILRLLFAFFDKIFYSLIVLIYELFMLISQAGIFSQATIQEFAARIYVFLGLIMVFKVSISLVTYILNPDNFNKADVGAPALLKGFAFSLIGIVLVPYVFEAAYSLQNIVLKDNLIGNLIMGMSDDNNSSDDYIRDAGIDMSFVTLTAFIRLDTQFPQISEACAADPVEITQAATADKKGEGKLRTECSEIEQVLGAEGTALLIEAYANRSISKLTDGDLLNVTSKLEDKDEFVMNYLPIISTAAGIFVAYIILLFCVDIAVRSVKLGFLQLIAPIPLIAKIDPKKGGEKFKKWMEECVSTYLDVFLRLAAIYFVLFIISAITTSGNSGIYNIVTGEGFSGVSGIFVKIFIIIGALNFARDLPKLLGKILGIDFKGMGGFSLNPMKNKNLAPLGAAAGLGTGLASGFATGGLGGALTGGLGAAGRGLLGTFGGKTSGDILKNQAGVNHDKLTNPYFSTTSRLANAARGYTGGLSAVDRANMDGDGRSIEEAMKDIDEKEIAPWKEKKAVYDDLEARNKNMRSTAESEIMKGKTGYSAEVLDQANKLASMKEKLSGMDVNDAGYGAYSTAVREESKKYDDNLQARVSDYIGDVQKDRASNMDITNDLQEMNGTISRNESIMDGLNINDYSGMTSISETNADGTITMKDVANSKLFKDGVATKKYESSGKIASAERSKAALQERKRTAQTTSEYKYTSHNNGGSGQKK